MKKTKKAQSLIEYGLILALVAVIAVTVLSKFGNTITAAGERTNTDVTNASTRATSTYCSSLTIQADIDACNAAAAPAQ